MLLMMDFYRMSDNGIQRTILVGVAGASGSGKSFFSNILKSQLGDLQTLILSQDDYYKARSSLSLAQRAKLNFDHPDAIDFDLLVQQLSKLKSGSAVEHPLYDFCTHDRKDETRTCGPADVVFVDGILVYVPKPCRDLFDYKIFVDTPADICLVRRLRRDVEERGRTMDSVLEQYMQTVRPMFEKFVAPTSDYADLVVAGMGDMLNEVGLVEKKIRSLLFC